MSSYKSVYDVMYAPPQLKKRLPMAQELLAQSIAASGKMRLDADDESNFVRLIASEERLDLTFTHREMEPKLIAQSEARILAALIKRYDAKAAQAMLPGFIRRVKDDLSKKHKVKPATEIKMARALVLCNELPVIALIHKEGAEIFISFGQSVGEVMDVARWERVGANSGLQAAGENAVYVSCGGHPFLDKKEYRHSGDGQPALARFMIIASQETGHNGDMIRGAGGKWVGRHSATDWYRAPSTAAGQGRLADIKTTEAIWEACRKWGLNRVAGWERNLEFFTRMKSGGLRRLRIWLQCRIGWQVFKILVKKKTGVVVPKLQKNPYPATLLNTFFSDMLANLTPQADVYKRKNPKEEEAVAVIEAVARVPQQVVKWGRHAVQAATPALYAFYYETIVPACARAMK